MKIRLIVAVAMLQLLQMPLFAESVGCLVSNADDQTLTGIRCVRNGNEVAVSDGMPIQEGDTVVTDKDSSAAVIFNDDSAVTLRESTTLMIKDYAYPQKKAETHLEVSNGNVFVAVNPRPAEAHFMLKTAVGTVEVKGTKFVVITGPGSTSGTFTTTVGVSSGQVTLKPDAASATTVDILAGTQTLFKVSTVSTNIPGYTGKTPPVTLDKTTSNLSGSAIKALEANAFSFASFSTSNNGNVSIQLTKTNVDGSITTTKRTIDATGKVITEQTSTTNATFTKKNPVEKVTISGGQVKTIVTNTALASTTENVSKGTFKTTLTGLSSTGTPTLGKGGRANLKNQLTITGTLTTNADGSVTGVGKDASGNTVTFTEYPDSTINSTPHTSTYTVTTSTGATQIYAVTESNGSSTTVTTTIPAGSTTGTQSITSYNGSTITTTTGAQVTVTKDSTGAVTGVTTIPNTGTTSTVSGGSHPPPPSL